MKDELLDSCLDCELAVLGTVVYGKHTSEVFGQVDESEFRNDEIRDIYTRFKKFWEENGSVDSGYIASLPDELKFIAFKSAETLPTHDYQRLIDALRNRNTVLDANVIGLRLMSAKDTEDVNSANDELQSLLREKKSEKAVSMEDLLPTFSQARSQPKQYISTGFNTLNNYLYLDQGDYVVIGARPSEGKTAIALNMATRMAKSGKRVGFFSLETSEMKIMDRIVAEMCGVNFGRIKRGKLFDDEWVKIAKSSEEIMRLPLYIIPAAGKTVAWIAAETMRLSLDIIFIDYLGLITGKGKSLYEQVTNISKDLHTFAQKNKVLVVALSQLNRGDPKQMPSLDRLRESGQIEQDVDVAMLLHNPPNGQDTRSCVLIVAKNKEGVCGTIDAVFCGSQQRFSIPERT